MSYFRTFKEVQARKAAPAVVSSSDSDSGPSSRGPRSGSVHDSAADAVSPSSPAEQQGTPSRSDRRLTAPPSTGRRLVRRRPRPPPSDSESSDGAVDVAALRRGMSNGEDLESFIVDDTDGGMEAAVAVADAEGVSGMLNQAMSVEEAVPIYVEFLLNVVADGEYLRWLRSPDGGAEGRGAREHARVMHRAIAVVERRLNTRRDSVAASGAWQADVRRDVERLPFCFSAELPVAKGDCEACGRSGHPATVVVTFGGAAYAARKVYGTPSFDSAFRSPRRRTRVSYRMGTTCARRTIAYSLLLHCKYHLMFYLSKRLAFLRGASPAPTQLVLARNRSAKNCSRHVEAIKNRSAVFTSLCKTVHTVLALADAMVEQKRSKKFQSTAVWHHSDDVLPPPGETGDERVDEGGPSSDSAGSDVSASDSVNLQRRRIPVSRGRRPPDGDLRKGGLAAAPRQRSPAGVRGGVAWAWARQLRKQRTSARSTDSGAAHVREIELEKPRVADQSDNEFELGDDTERVGVGVPGRESGSDDAGGRRGPSAGVRWLGGRDQSSEEGGREGNTDGSDDGATGSPSGGDGATKLARSGWQAQDSETPAGARKRRLTAAQRLLNGLSGKRARGAAAVSSEGSAPARRQSLLLAARRARRVDEAVAPNDESDEAGVARDAGAVRTGAGAPPAARQRPVAVAWRDQAAGVVVLAGTPEGVRVQIGRCDPGSSWHVVREESVSDFGGTAVVHLPRRYSAVPVRLRVGTSATAAAGGWSEPVVARVTGAEIK